MRWPSPWSTRAHAILIVLAVWSTAFALQATGAWREVELKVFDALTVLTAPRKTVLPITIVAIDEASFAQVNVRWPWPRSLFARVVERLAQAGAAVIVLDVLFPETSDPADDEALAHAIRRAGNVVLAADHAYQETTQLRQWLRVDPAAVFTGAGAVSGLATVELDSDGFVRSVPQASDALWRRTIETLLRARPGLVEQPDASAELMIRHLGPPQTFPYVSFYQLLSGDGAIGGDHFRDQIVFIGRATRSSLGAGTAQDDLFATSFLATSGKLTPGVEVHATIVENMLTDRAITVLDPQWALVLMTALLALAVPALLRWHPLWSGVWILALAACAAGGAAWSFGQYNLWWPAGATVAALAALYVAMGLASYISERRRAEQVTNAFGKYVSPQVVRELMARPELLKLGGRRREVTVLFTDLAGFTSISERLPPENVAQVVNTYLTAMTRLIMAAGGTVDKFIGDAVMAFWGAPLDDPDHALHAVGTAMAMQEAMAKLQPALTALGCAGLSMRIGINSGPVIVGNMGSEDRFDYTVVGDCVNLASRLEGVNKLYGTRILVSENTARLLPAGFSLRKVDVVRVAGKKQPVSIFSPCEDPELVLRSDAALRAYGDGDWPGACRAWEHVLAHAPGDGVATLFLERIEGFRLEGPPRDWDGAVELTKA
jgi:adenylate cyclase